MFWWLAGMAFYIAGAAAFYGALMATSQPEPVSREMRYARRDEWRKAA